MGGMGMSMGAPSMTAGAGMDSNNYLDVRKEQHNTDQGTIRIDRVFDRGDIVFARYSAGGEYGFMPQNLPGFGANHDNLAQNGNISWSRIITPNVLNTASVAVFAAEHESLFAKQRIERDHVGTRHAEASASAGQARMAHLTSMCRATRVSATAMPRHRCTPGIRFWRAAIALTWQRGRHSLKFGGSYRWYIWPMWGFFQNRGYYQFTNGFTTETASNDNTGSALASFLLGLPAVRQRQAHLEHGPAAMVCGRVCPGYVATDTCNDSRIRASL